ncbi:outer membrane protein assembly factor BamE [Herbaspirillum lusitanum]|uniref:outer membrane protein assembly factor BamE domain-containing protein n=1 Tax=Herbaspirillum lusitanum TaxID=213312 RepID=UPI0038993963|nr:outer membrane protein assembly factor BamE [Herbaspirillum lusitanum]
MTMIKNKLLARLAAICATVLALGCDRNGNPVEEFGLDKLNKGASTEADVRSVMGQPDSVREESDGGRTLEYPKGPQGVRTWMFRIGADGKLSDYQQVLTAENFDRVQKGMTREEVRNMLGRPRTVMPFARKKEEVWDWKYLHVHEERLFNVHFDMETGKVVRMSISEISGH